MEELAAAEKNIPQAKKRQQTKIMVGIVFLALAYFAYGFFFDRKEKAETGKSEPAPVEQSPEQPEEIAQKHTVAEGDIPADIFAEYGKFDANDTEKILAAAENIYDLSKIKIGRELRFYFNGESKAIKMEYDRDTEKKVVVKKNGETFSVREENIPYAVSRETVRAEIENFLYADALETGLSEATVLEISDIFSFDIDFTTEVQKGDQFSVSYEKRTLAGEKAPDGKILAAKFINEGKSYYAYYFESGGQGGHYDSEGKLLERQFLRAPLSYRRITSGFTGARFHPITKKVTAHYQIDYAAPMGTPVISTAHGTVVSAGWEGGWGRMLRIRHDNGYTTHYAHLSGFDKNIRSGVRVKRGQVVGFVGSTGWSTGPHLDYGIKLNGAPINPLKMDLPKGAPLEGEKMKEFEKIKAAYVTQL